MEEGIWIFLLLFLKCSYGQHSSLHTDFMSREDKDGIIKLALELLQVIHLEHRQLLDVKYQHNTRISYQVGLVIGTVREKYKRIMDIYREMTDRRNGKFVIMGPGIWKMKPLHYVIAMETVRVLEIEIDKYIHVLEGIPENVLNGEFNGRGSKSQQAGMPPAVKTQSGLRTYTKEDPAPVTAGPRTFKNEEDLKRHYREGYMKKAGLKGKDWSLDHYYGFA